MRHPVCLVLKAVGLSFLCNEIISIFNDESSI